VIEVVHYEDVNVGDEIPPLEKTITKEQLIEYADASLDYNPIHVVDDFAKKAGLGGVIGHGLLSLAFLAQMLTDWIEKPTDLKKLSVRFVGMTRPGDKITSKGKITNKYEKDGVGYVECELVSENQKGQKTVTGKATVVLPRKG